MKPAAQKEYGEIIKLEKSLLEPSVRNNRAYLEEVFGEDFIEIGKSGKIYGRQQVMQSLAGESSSASYTMSEFSVTAISPDIFLIIYLVTSGGEKTRSVRSSVWKREQDKWTIVFHQGTAVH